MSESRLSPGYRLDRYELLCPVAQGGMAEVWLARFQGKHGFEKLVAIKTILTVYAGDQQFRQMFLDEATIASRIEHTHVAQILDLGEQDGMLYLVMEWVEGDSLSRLERVVNQAGSVVPQAIALRLVADACAGLHAAHEQHDATGRPLNVVHRDVSPQNILISAKGVVKVIDFGIAKARDRAAEETRTGVFKGKLHYMAPEQALGKVIDRRADVWAVAAVLYRMLSQRYVYDAGNRVETLRMLTTNALRVPLPLHVPRSIAAIVEKALAFEPEQRHASCAELQADLERASAAESLSVTTPELAAYVVQHLGDRIDSRRRALNTALHALGHGSSLEQAPPETPSEAENTQVLPSTKVDGRPFSEQRSETTRPWTPHPSESSFNTRSTFVDGQRRSIPAGRRKLGAAVLIGVAAAGLVLALWLRSSRQELEQPGSSLAQTASAAQPIGVAATATPPATEPPPSTPTVNAAPEPPEPKVVSVDSLPLTAPTPAAAPAAAPPTRTTVKAHGKAPASTAPKPKRKVIDDGF